jgi:hypothetical protein
MGLNRHPFGRRLKRSPDRRQVFADTRRRSTSEGDARYGKRLGDFTRLGKYGDGNRRSFGSLSNGNFARRQIRKILAFWLSEEIARREEVEFRLLIQLHRCRSLFFPLLLLGDFNAHRARIAAAKGPFDGLRDRSAL